MLVVPTCVAVTGNGGGAHVCGSGRPCGGGGPRVWQWKAVVVVPTCVAVADGVVVVPMCVVVEGGVPS